MALGWWISHFPWGRWSSARSWQVTERIWRRYGYDERAYLRRVRAPHAGQHAHGLAIARGARIHLSHRVRPDLVVDGARRISRRDVGLLRRHRRASPRHDDIGRLPRPLGGQGHRPRIALRLDSRAAARPQGLHHSRRDHHASRDLDERLSRPCRTPRDLDSGEQAREMEDVHARLGHRPLCHTVDCAPRLDRRHGHLDRGGPDPLYRLAVLRRRQEGRSACELRSWPSVPNYCSARFPIRTRSGLVNNWRPTASHRSFTSTSATITSEFFWPFERRSRVATRSSCAADSDRPKTTSRAPRWLK